MNVLVAYAGTQGSTREVAEAVDVQPAAAVATLTPSGAVVLGGPLSFGRRHRAGGAFLRQHGEALATLPLAVVALGAPTLAGVDVAGSREQLDNALAEVPAVQPGTRSRPGLRSSPPDSATPLAAAGA